MNAPMKGRRPATYQDVLDAPPNMVAEIARGVGHPWLAGPLRAD